MWLKLKCVIVFKIFFARESTFTTGQREGCQASPRTKKCGQQATNHWLIPRQMNNWSTKVKGKNILTKVGKKSNNINYWNSIVVGY